MIVAPVAWRARGRSASHPSGETLAGEESSGTQSRRGQGGRETRGRPCAGSGAAHSERDSESALDEAINPPRAVLAGVRGPRVSVRQLVRLSGSWARMRLAAWIGGNTERWCGRCEGGKDVKVCVVNQPRHPPHHPTTPQSAIDRHPASCIYSFIRNRHSSSSLSSSSFDRIFPQPPSIPLELCRTTTDNAPDCVPCVT